VSRRSVLVLTAGLTLACLPLIRAGTERTEPIAVRAAAAPDVGEAAPQARAYSPPLVVPRLVRGGVSVVPSPFPSASFLAQADVPAVGATRTESPPDTSGAVGRDELMVALNSNYVIQRKSDGALLSRMSMDEFWKPVGATHPFDPRVLYDPYSDRWLVSAGDDPLLASSKILYGISETGNPLGRWDLYSLPADRSGATWADFPTLGFSRNTVAIGVNMFTTGGLTYAGGRLIALDYANLRAGGNGSPVDLNVPDGFALQPVSTYSATEGTLYVVEHLDSQTARYRLWSLDGSKLSLVGGAPKVNPLGGWSTPSAGNVLPQEGGGGIDSGDSRVGSAVLRAGHIYYAQTIGGLQSQHSAVQWVELDTDGNFVQGGRIDDPSANPWNGGKSYAFPSIAVNAAGDVIVGFSEFQAGDFVDAGYAYRESGDPPNTLRAPVTLKEGEGVYEKYRSGRNRWGDYSSSQADPVDDSLWTLQEYARAPSGKGNRSGRWGVWWGRVGDGPEVVRPQCVVPAATGKTLSAARALLTAGRCSVGSVARVKAAKNRRGKVVRQYPAPGTTLDADFRVDLWLGKGR
jgi:hypothetical protein